MLTRKEANALYAKLKLQKESYYDYVAMVREFIDTIEQFTEEPKREVKVGDIYIDGRGIPEIIVLIEAGERYPLKTNTGVNYTAEGRLYINETSPLDLDLSKRYKLVETDDVN